jgi:hypothetical protein
LPCAQLYKRVELIVEDLLVLTSATAHKAADNETMQEIADLYGVDVDELVKLNKRGLQHPLFLFVFVLARARVCVCVCVCARALACVRALASARVGRGGGHFVKCCGVL